MAMVTHEQHDDNPSMKARCMDALAALPDGDYWDNLRIAMADITSGRAHPDELAEAVLNFAQEAGDIDPAAAFRGAWEALAVTPDAFEAALGELCAAHTEPVLAAVALGRIYEGAREIYASIDAALSDALSIADPAGWRG